MQPLINYINDKNANTAFELGYYYENNNQLAAAIGHYLEAVDLTSSTTMEYECLLRSALCFEKQGDRTGTTYSTLYTAISILPGRPEAIYHLIRILNYHKKYYETYALAQLHLTRFSLPLNPLLKNCDYEGIHTIIFEKGVASWWIGKFEEARTIMYDISVGNYSQRFVNAALYNIKSIGYPTLYKHTPDKILKKHFNNSKTYNYSQAMQDMFVLSILDGKTNGTYLEIGSGDPQNNSNTYLLEKEFDWYGVSVEIDYHKVMRFGLHRDNPVIMSDATKVDYTHVMTDTPIIDYLQVDCDPASLSYDVLKKIIDSNKQFNVITFEHDAYREGNTWREKSRELLSKDYVLTVADVCCVEGKNFEDWWVHKRIFKPSMLGESFKTANKYFY